MTSPYDADSQAMARVTAAVIAAGREPRRGTTDLMIAATAIVAELPLYTTNPDDFASLDHLVTVIPVTGPEVTRALRRPGPSCTSFPGKRAHLPPAVNVVLRHVRYPTLQKQPSRPSKTGQSRSIRVGGYGPLSHRHRQFSA